MWQSLCEWLITPGDQTRLTERIIGVMGAIQNLKLTIAAVEELRDRNEKTNLPLTKDDAERRQHQLRKAHKVLRQLEVELSLYGKDQIDTAIREHKKA
jgi:hypothetical protein